MPKQIARQSTRIQNKTKLISKVPKSTHFIIPANKHAREALWDTSKFKLGQWFSQTGYLKVISINNESVTVQNQWGDNMLVSKSILYQMQSADHFDTEVTCSKTELARLLQTASDTVMTVVFRKKLNEEYLLRQLNNFKGTFADRV